MGGPNVEAPLRNIDFSSWQGLFTTLIGLALFALVGVGFRLLMMFTIQQRRERMNRQINERLRTLIAAYKTLGGSFTGRLTVDPTHLRDIRRRDQPITETESVVALEMPAEAPMGSERTRRIRDAVEAALSDVILLGTERHVRLADHAVRELVAGRPVHTHELVVALRDYIREALDIDPIPPDLSIPMQGPTRPSSTASRGKGERDSSGAEGKSGGGQGMGGGAGGGGGIGLGGGGVEDTPPSDHRP